MSAIFCQSSASASSRNGNFLQMERFQLAGTEKGENSRRLYICSGKFPFDPRVQFAFQPVEPEILAKRKAALVFIREFFSGLSGCL